MFNYAVIYAAGEGIRLRPLTEYVPKALVQVEKKELIKHSIDFFKKNKIKNTYITYGYKGNQLLSYLHPYVSGFINTTSQDNSYFLFNTIVRHINEPVLCLPCDLIFSINLKQLYKNYYKIGAPPIALVPVPTKQCPNGDKILTHKNTITKIGKFNDVTDISASGIQIINPYKLNTIVSTLSNFNQVWNYLIKQRRLLITDIQPTKWKTCDTLEQLFNYE